MLRQLRIAIAIWNIGHNKAVFLMCWRLWRLGHSWKTIKGYFIYSKACYSKGRLKEIIEEAK